METVRVERHMVPGVVLPWVASIIEGSWLRCTGLVTAWLVTFPIALVLDGAGGIAPNPWEFLRNKRPGAWVVTGLVPRVAVLSWVARGERLGSLSGRRIQDADRRDARRGTTSKPGN